MNIRARKICIRVNDINMYYTLYVILHTLFHYQQILCKREKLIERVKKTYEHHR